MKKLLFIPIAFALVAPLAIGTNNLSARANPLVPTNSSTSKTTFAALTSIWYQYKATDGSYSALFPGKPSQSVQSNSDVEVIYEDRANNRAYLMQSVKLSPNPSPPDVEKVLVEKALDAGVASVSKDGNTVTNLKAISLNGLSGREITVRRNDGTVMKMRMFINPKVPALYIAGVAVEKGNLDFPEAQAFLDSVSIAQK